MKYRRNERWLQGFTELVAADINRHKNDKGAAFSRNHGMEDEVRSLRARADDNDVRHGRELGTLTSRIRALRNSAQLSPVRSEPAGIAGEYYDVSWRRKDPAILQKDATRRSKPPLGMWLVRRQLTDNRGPATLSGAGQLSRSATAGGAEQHRAGHSATASGAERRASSRPPAGVNPAFT